MNKFVEFAVPFCGVAVWVLGLSLFLAFGLPAIAQNQRDPETQALIESLAAQRNEQANTVAAINARSVRERAEYAAEIEKLKKELAACKPEPKPPAKK